MSAVSSPGTISLSGSDPQGVQREYVDAQSGGEERLVGYSIPTGGDYTIVVRNSLNTQVDYRLTVQPAGGAP